MNMDISRELVSILFVFATARAQTTTNQINMNPLHPSLAVVLVVLSVMLCITFSIVAYAKFCHRHTLYPLTEIQDPSGIVSSTSRFSGVDRTIIESLPFFTFSSLLGSKEGLECVVCLSRFEDSEILRLLPKCSHAFHVSCIDKWLESHSSCPLCRYKFDVEDLKCFAYASNSFRDQRTNYTPSQEQQNLEFYVQREQSTFIEKSSRFTFQRLSRFKREEPLIRKMEIDRNVSRFQHKIIISDVIQRSRWSEVNSLDLMSLNSDMLNAFSSRRFSTSGESRGGYIQEISTTEQMSKIKDDMDRKRLYESMMISGATTEKTASDGHQTCSSVGAENVSRSLHSDQKRSMSEITNVSRFTNVGVSSNGSTEKNEKIRRLWLPIARSTIQLFGSQEQSSLDHV